QNILNLLRQSSIIGIISAGMTFVIISGNFDISVGAVAALAGAPTDISKFPDIITKVIPAEIIPIIEDCRKRLSIFCLPKNDGV
ncbi:hypothetical protein ACTPD5_22685, partial [Clostridioides difficile]